MGVLVGIDYGLRRTGVAVSDAGQTLAAPLTVIDQTDASTVARRVAELAADHEAEGVVVGLPLNMDGTEGEQARVTRRFARLLAETTGLPVHLHDERLSSFQADVLLSAARGRRSRRQSADAAAAAVILQAWLDQLKTTRETESEAGD